jgi:sulfofructose kinase
MPLQESTVDVVGVGLNATDMIIRLPHFPAFNSKVEIIESRVTLGGQVASAIAACAKWGLSTRYVGKIGDDPAGELQRNEMKEAGVDAHWVIAPWCQSQSAFILVDDPSGERTVLWKRDPRLELRSNEICEEWITQSRLLHVDGHDCKAAGAAAQWARRAGIVVTADLDNLYPGVDSLLENVDYLISSAEFPARLTSESDVLLSLPLIARRFGCRVVGATLGSDGVLAWDGTGFQYSPAFEVVPVDTTGAGDIFHGAFAYAVLQGWGLERSLEFSNAAAGLACTAPGARGCIASLEQIRELIHDGRRRPSLFSEPQLQAAIPTA